MTSDNIIHIRIERQVMMCDDYLYDIGEVSIKVKNKNAMRLNVGERNTVYTFVTLNKSYHIINN